MIWGVRCGGTREASRLLAIRLSLEVSRVINPKQARSQKDAVKRKETRAGHVKRSSHERKGTPVFLKSGRTMAHAPGGLLYWCFPNSG